MRVFHCIPSLASGGAERQIAYLVAEQVRQGHAVDVAFVHGGPNLERLERSGAGLHQIPALNNHDPAILYRLIRLIRKLRPDVVQTWLTQMDVLGGLAAAVCRVPWVLSERCSLLSYEPSFKNKLRQLLGARAQAIVSNSAGGTDYWRGHTRARTMLEEIPNPLPKEEIDATPAASDAELGVAADDTVVLVVGRLVPQKNLPPLIEALALAAERAPFVVRICGEGDAESVQRLIDGKGLSSRVKLVGYVGTVWSWMKRADLFVSVSLFEGRPNAVLEAALCGCPLLLSDISSHREVFGDDSAQFVDPNQPAAIADALVRCLQPGAMSARVERARHLAEGLTTTAVERKYLDVYRKITEATV